MTDDRPLIRRRLGLWNFVVGLIALFAVIAIAAALAERRMDLAVLAIVLVVVGIPLAYWTRRLRNSLSDDSSSTKQA